MSFTDKVQMCQLKQIISRHTIAKMSLDLNLMNSYRHSFTQSSARTYTSADSLSKGSESMRGGKYSGDRAFEAKTNLSVLCRFTSSCPLLVSPPPPVFVLHTGAILCARKVENWHTCCQTNPRSETFGHPGRRTREQAHAKLWTHHQKRTHHVLSRHQMCHHDLFRIPYSILSSVLSLWLFSSLAFPAGATLALWEGPRPVSHSQSEFSPESVVLRECLWFFRSAATPHHNSPWIEAWWTCPSGVLLYVALPKNQ